jgi:hypothetical protein
MYAEKRMKGLEEHIKREMDRAGIAHVTDGIVLFFTNERLIRIEYKGDPIWEGNA